MVAWWRNGRALDLRSRGRGFDSRVGAQLRNDRGQVAHTRLPSASEVTTIWRYANLYFIIIIVLLLDVCSENKDNSSAAVFVGNQIVSGDVGVRSGERCDG